MSNLVELSLVVGDLPLQFPERVLYSQRVLLHIRIICSIVHLFGMMFSWMATLL